MLARTPSTGARRLTRRSILGWSLGLAGLGLLEACSSAAPSASAPTQQAPAATSAPAATTAPAATSAPATTAPATGATSCSHGGGGRRRPAQTGWHLHLRHRPGLHHARSPQAGPAQRSERPPRAVRRPGAHERSDGGAAGARRKLGGARPDHVYLQAAPGREIPQRARADRRRREVYARPGGGYRHRLPLGILLAAPVRPRRSPGSVHAKDGQQGAVRSADRRPAPKS